MEDILDYKETQPPKRDVKGYIKWAIFYIIFMLLTGTILQNITIGVYEYETPTYVWALIAFVYMLGFIAISTIYLYIKQTLQKKEQIDQDAPPFWFRAIELSLLLWFGSIVLFIVNGLTGFSK